MGFSGVSAALALRFGDQRFYEFMREVAPGDIVFSFYRTRIHAIGIAESYCYECPKPRIIARAETLDTQSLRGRRVPEYQQDNVARRDSLAHHKAEFRS